MAPPLLAPGMFDLAKQYEKLESVMFTLFPARYIAPPDVALWRAKTDSVILVFEPLM